MRSPSFAENLSPLVDSSSNFLLLFDRQMDHMLTFFGAAAIVLLRTVFALYEKKMTTVVPAVCVIVTRFATLVTMTYNIGGDSFAKTLIEDEILSNEFILEAFFFYLSCIFNDATFQLEYIFEALMFHPGTCLLATNAAGAVHDQVLVLLTFEHVVHDLELFTESVGIGTNSVPEMPDFALVVIAHVYDNCVGLIRKLIELFGVHMLAAVGYIERRIIDTICDDLASNEDLKLEE